MPTIDDLHALDIRVGTITAAAPNPKARVPAYVLTIDLGAEHRTSSAQLTERYEPDDLVGTQVVCVCALPPRRVAGVKSECLVLGVVGDEPTRLLRPDAPAPNGARIA